MSLAAVFGVLRMCGRGAAPHEHTGVRGDRAAAVTGRSEGQVAKQWTSVNAAEEDAQGHCHARRVRSFNILTWPVLARNAHAVP
jgi:hypothetical protein